MKKESNKEDKARVRVFFGEIEGDNDTIRDGLKSIAEAVNKTFQQETRIVRVLATSADVNQKNLVTEFEQKIIDVESEDIQDGETPLFPEYAKPKSRTSQPKKTPSYSLVKDLNLRPEAKKSLRDFFKEKTPTTQQDSLIVILYYLSRILELENISINHIYTGLKDLTEFGVRVPGDIAQVMRTTASKKGWLDTSDANSLKMAVSGDNFVEHDLPNTKK
jgi:hypothetical protein